MLKSSGLRAVGSYLPSYPFGFGSTPILHKEILIVVIGTEEGGFLAALEVLRRQRGLEDSDEPVTTTGPLRPSRLSGAEEQLFHFWD